VKLQFIESISKVGLEKKFYVKDFFTQFSIPNKEQTRIKRNIVNVFHKLKEENYIEDRLQLITKNG